MSLLHDLVMVEFLSMDEYRALQRAYMKYRESLHVLDLQYASHTVPSRDMEELSLSVERVFTDPI